MLDVLNNVKTKSGNQEHFLSFGFNADDGKIYGTRGFSGFIENEFSQNFFEKKVV